MSVIFLLSGCSAVQMRVQPHHQAEELELRRAGVAGKLPSRQALSRQGAGEEEMRSLVATARKVWPGMLRGDEKDTLLYRAALRRLVLLGERARWSGSFPFEIVRSGKGVLDSSAADKIVPADQVMIRGVPQRVTQDGLGLPCVAWFDADSKFLRGEPGVPTAGMAIPVTALLTFDKRGAATWRFVRTLQKDRWTVNGRGRQLAADFSAPLAMIIAKGDNRSIDLGALFRPLESRHGAGLYQFQPYDPNKIPVVFIHGLMSRPETWRFMVNELMADRYIRKNYQFWFFLYPTGFPVWKSAAELRSELDRFNRELGLRARTAQQRRRLRSKVLVGHSMGGLVASLQVREGGETLWARFSEVPLRDLPVGPEARQRIEEMLVFEPRTDVSRVIFAGVPHRGSPMALRPTARFFAARVRFVIPEIQRYRPFLIRKAHADLRRDLAEPANSIRFLRMNSPFLEAILAAPRDPRVKVYSIIGDRGRNDAPDGGDGVVPFISAHYPGAQSEKIIPSGHNVHAHPDGVREVARILRKSPAN